MFLHAENKLGVLVKNKNSENNLNDVEFTEYDTIRSFGNLFVNFVTGSDGIPAILLKKNMHSFCFLN